MQKMIGKMAKPPAVVWNGIPVYRNHPGPHRYYWNLTAEGGSVGEIL